MRTRLAAILLLAAAPAAAEPPRVVADILPVHGLAAMVMGDLGEPGLLLPGNADPHVFQMRPTQARALAEADLVVWMGSGLTPWLQSAIGNLAGEVPESLELLELDDLPMVAEDGVIRFVASGQEMRIEVGHDEHEDGEHGEDHGDNDGHEDHDDHGDGHDDHSDDHDDHDDHKDHDDEDHGKEEHGHGHGHGSLDPHAWLDPVNAIAFIQAIADALAEVDPQNAASYRRNALAAEARIESLVKQVERRLASRRDVVLIPYHDAFQYFLARFGFEIHGGIADHEGTAPGAARLAEIRSQLSNVPHGCVFSEPGANAALFEAAIPGGHIGRGELDPLGAAIQPGRDFYPALIESLADAIADCLPG